MTTPASDTSHLLPAQQQNVNDLDDSKLESSKLSNIADDIPVRNREPTGSAKDVPESPLGNQNLDRKPSSDAANHPIDNIKSDAEATKSDTEAAKLDKTASESKMLDENKQGVSSQPSLILEEPQSESAKGAREKEHNDMHEIINDSEPVIKEGRSDLGQLREDANAASAIKNSSIEQSIGKQQIDSNPMTSHDSHWSQ